MGLNKNEAARIRRVQQSLEKVMDALHTAQGQLYPPGLKVYKSQIAKLISEAEKLTDKIRADLPRKLAQMPLRYDEEDADEPQEAHHPDV